MARRRNTPALRCLALAAAVGVFAAAGPVVADEPSPAEIAAAHQLFNDGKELEKRGSWAEALEKFKKVAEVKLTPQVRFHMALCSEHTGQLVAALNGFELALDEARRVGSAAAEVSENAPVRIDAIRKRVPIVRLEPKDDLAGSKVTLDGTAVAAALIGTDIPVDPGKHVVEMERGGQTVLHKEFAVAERASQTIELEPQESGSAAVAPTPTARPTDESPPPSPPDRTTSSGPGRWPAFVAAGVSVASFGAAAVFFVMRQSTINDVRASCVGKQPDTGCDPSLSSSADRGRTYTLAGDVLLGVGAATALAAGVLWFVLAPSSNKPATKGTVRLGPTIGGGSLFATF